MPEYEFVLSTSDGPVGVVTLNRPKQLNALAGPLMAELVDALEQHDNDPAIRAIVITGGPAVFAAGADIKEMADATAVEMLLRNNIGLWDRAKKISKPLIAAVAGYALGGGCELAMLCDIIIAAETAKFGQPEITIGTMPGMGGTQRLPRAVGKAKAMDWCLTGRMIDADEAERSGLVARVVPNDKLESEALALAAKIASHSLTVVMKVKEAINRAYESSLFDALLFERRDFHSTFALDDQKEGMRAFVDKRPPVFKNR